MSLSRRYRSFKAVWLLLAAGILVLTAAMTSRYPAVLSAEPIVGDCPYREHTPPPVDASEAPSPGDTVPQPLPVPSPPVGGENLTGCHVAHPAGTSVPPFETQTAKGWIVSDLDSGEVIGAHDPHGRFRPASTIKLLLALTVVHELHLNHIAVGDVSDSHAEGDSVGIAPGGRYTVDQLLHGLLMVSGNDAAHTLARQFGSIDKALEQMNAYAKYLGALDTRATSPSGLDHIGMSSSPYDLSLFLRKALHEPELAHILSLKNYAFPDGKGGSSYPIVSQNQFVAADRGGIGGKTGYTDDAKKTYVGALVRNGRRLLVAQMFGLSVGDNSYWNQADALASWASKIPAGKYIGTLVSPGYNGASEPNLKTASETISNSANSHTKAHDGSTTHVIADHNGDSWWVYIVSGLAILLILSLVGLRLNAIHQQKERRRIAQRRAQRARSRSIK